MGPNIVGELDFVHLGCGLALLLSAVVILRRRRAYAILPWGFLAASGFTAGLAQWLLVPQAVLQKGILSAMAQGLDLISAVALLEFGIMGLFAARAKRPNQALFIALVLLGTCAGVGGWIGAVRSVQAVAGIVGGILAAAAMLLRAKQQTAGRRSLAAAAVATGLMGFAITAGATLWQAGIALKGEALTQLASAAMGALAADMLALAAALVYLWDRRTSPPSQTDLYHSELPGHYHALALLALCPILLAGWAVAQRLGGHIASGAAAGSGQALAGIVRLLCCEIVLLACALVGAAYVYACQRRQWLARTAAAHDRCQAAINAALTPLALFDRQGRYLAANEAAFETFEIEPCQLLGRTLLEVVSVPSQPAAAGALAQVTNGQSAAFDAQVQLPGYQEATLHFSLQPVTDDDGVVRCFVGGAAAATHVGPSLEIIPAAQTLQQASAKLEQLRQSMWANDWTRAASLVREFGMITMEFASTAFSGMTSHLAQAVLRRDTEQATLSLAPLRENLRRLSVFSTPPAVPSALTAK